MSIEKVRVQFKQKLGAEIARLREGKGWKQTHLAEQVGVRSASVSQWERGRVSPQAAMLVTVAEALDTTLPDLLAPALPGFAKDPRSAVKPDPRRALVFYEFTARIAGHKWLRRAVLALADEEERQQFDETLRRAEDLQ